RSLSLDAPEARPGLTFRQLAPGVPGQSAGDRAPERSVHVGGVLLGPDPESARSTDAQRAQARKHGCSGERAGHRPAHVRGCAGSLPRAIRLKNPLSSQISKLQAVTITDVAACIRRW